MRYQVVDDNLRSDEDQELIDELLAGRTVFIAGADNNRINVLYGRIRTRYRRALRRRQHTIDGADGYVVWLDAEESRPDQPPTPNATW